MHGEISRDPIRAGAASQRNDRPRRKRFIALLCAGLVLAGGGGAYAYWSSVGTGTGTAITTTAGATLTIVQSPVSGLAPGVSASTLSGTFNNPNSGPVYVNSVTATGLTVTKAAGATAGTCDATDYTLSATTMAVNAEVPTGNGKGSWGGATLAFNDKSGTNQDACKGATVTVSYSAS